MRKNLWFVPVLLFLLIIAGSIASASPETGNSGRSTLVPVPGSNQLDPRNEATGPSEAAVLDADTIISQDTSGKRPVVLTTELSEIAASCRVGWYPCQGGVCYGWGCPSYACGPCNPSVAGGAPGIANCEGWTWNGFVSICECKSAEGVTLIRASCPGACVIPKRR